VTVVEMFVPRNVPVYSLALTIMRSLRGAFLSKDVTSEQTERRDASHEGA